MQGLAAQVTERDNHVELLKDELERKRTELAVAYEAYERMQASTSWRVTRPLRQVAALKDRKGATPGA